MQEKDRLCEVVGRLGTADWPGVSAEMGDAHTPAACRAAWRAMLKEARVAKGEVMSPCTKVCKLDRESSTYCYGCFRDMDAIGGWSSFDNDQKRTALEAAAKRKVEHERLYMVATRLVNAATALKNAPKEKVASSFVEEVATAAETAREFIGYLNPVAKR